MISWFIGICERLFFCISHFCKLQLCCKLNIEHSNIAKTCIICFEETIKDFETNFAAFTFVLPNTSSYNELRVRVYLFCHRRKCLWSRSVNSNFFSRQVQFFWKKPLVYVSPRQFFHCDIDTSTLSSILQFFPSAGTLKQLFLIIIYQPEHWLLLQLNLPNFISKDWSWLFTQIERLN
jgi:hypothetical protein